MTKEERDNWQKIKDHFEELPEEQRENEFYRRACAIVAGGEDPIEPLPVETSD